MSEENTVPKVMLFGGIAILIIVLGGVYLSANPQKIAQWQYQRDSARQEAMQQVILEAPESCDGVDTAVFSAACEVLEEAKTWYRQLPIKSQACLGESYRTTTIFKLEFDGDSESDLKHMLTEEDFALHACGVMEDSNYYLKDQVSRDASELLNNWYRWKHSEGNYFN